MVKHLEKNKRKLHKMQRCAVTSKLCGKFADKAIITI